MDHWEKRRAKKDFRQFPRLLAESIKLVRETSGPRVSVIVLLRIVSGLMSGVMLLLGRDALAAFGGAGPGGFFQPLGMLGLVYGLSMIFGLISGEMETFVTAQAQRKTMDEVLDVATTVRLEAYESPQFFDHLKRVETNALVQPANSRAHPDADAITSGGSGSGHGRPARPSASAASNRAYQHDPTCPDDAAERPALV